MYGRFLRLLSANGRALSPHNTTRKSTVNIHVVHRPIYLLFVHRRRLLASMADAGEGKLSKKLVFLTTFITIARLICDQRR